MFYEDNYRQSSKKERKMLVRWNEEIKLVILIIESILRKRKERKRIIGRFNQG